MQGKIDSLNILVSLAVIKFEAMRGEGLSNSKDAKKSCFQLGVKLFEVYKIVEMLRTTSLISRK